MAINPKWFVGELGGGLGNGLFASSIYVMLPRILLVVFGLPEDVSILNFYIFMTAIEGEDVGTVSSSREQVVSSMY